MLTTRKKIQESLNNLVKDKTVVIISHRMKSIENADKIVVLQNGRVESEGKHEELLQNQNLQNLIEKTKNGRRIYLLGGLQWIIKN